MTALISTIIPSVAFLPHFGSNKSATASSAGELRSDFNGDGYDDLAIGAAGEEIGGAVNVLYGFTNGLQSSSPADQLWSQNSPGVNDAAESGDAFGQSLASADFNNDGYDDLAIGVAENLGEIVGAGAVHVLYGSEGGLQTSSPVDQFWHQNSPGVEDVAENYEQFGSTLAAGDFNNDGYDDLAIGVPGESIGAVLFAGAANVLYGSAGGLQTSSPADQFWHQNSPGVEDAVEENEGFFAASLTSGDFNDDGFADLAIGITLERIEGEVSFNHGAVEVLYGSSSGLRAVSPADQFWHQNSPGVNNSVERDDNFGNSLAAGDFNSDGYDDLAIGARGEGISRQHSVGAVHVLYGSEGGLQTSSPADQFWHQDSIGVEDKLEVGDEFGWSLTTGDFNNDGYCDLAIGVHDEFIDEGGAEGAVNVLYGSSSGLQPSSPADQFWHQNSPGVDDIAEAADGFGVSLAAGDFNNDGAADLAIGVSQESIGSDLAAESHGAVNVLYGSNSGLQTSTPADQFWHQNSPGVNDVAEPGDHFGFSLS